MTGDPSETALAAALLRAAHQVLDAEPHVLEDPVSLGLVSGSRPDEIRARADALDAPFMRNLRASFVVRSRIAEDALHRESDRGARGYVMLGAGFDTFAFRQPAWSRVLDVYELDHPSSQAAKRESVSDRGLAIPENLHWCPVDFEREGPRSALARAGRPLGGSALFSWLGVVPYLSADAIDATLREVAAFGRATSLVLSYVVPDSELAGVDAETVALSSRASAARGEPWVSRFLPGEMEDKLRSAGFDSLEHHGPAETEPRFFRGRSDDLQAPGFERVIVAKKAA